MDPAPLDWAAVVPCEWDGGPRKCTKAGQITALDGTKLCSNHWQKSKVSLDITASTPSPPHDSPTPSHRLRVAFISPKSFQPWEALAAGYIKSFCDSPTHPDGSPRPDALDAEWLFFDRWFDSFKDTVAGAAGCDFVLIGAASSQYADAKRIARAIKKLTPGTKTIIGGYHATALPDKVATEDCWDWVVLREGEEAALQIMQGRTGPWNQKSPLSPKIIEVDQLTEAQLSALYPDRRFVKAERNLAQAMEENEGEKICAVFSSRGCPYSCSFCSSKQVFARVTRHRTPESVWSEVQWLIENLGMTYLKFSDDLIASSNTHALALFRAKMAHPDPRVREIPWGANLRCNANTEELAEVFRASGCDTLWIGFESGSPRMLRNMMKSIKVPDIKWTFDLLERHGIDRRSYLILGVSGEDEASIWETRELVREVMPNTVGVTIMCPYPGTMEYWLPIPHHPDGLSYGEHISTFENMDEYGNTQTRTEALTNTQLRSAQRYLLTDFEAHGMEVSHHAKRQWILDAEYDPSFLLEAWGESEP